MLYLHSKVVYFLTGHDNEKYENTETHTEFTGFSTKLYASAGAKGIANSGNLQVGEVRHEDARNTNRTFWN